MLTHYTSSKNHEVFFFQAEDGIRDVAVTGVQTCALPICFFGAIGRQVVRGTGQDKTAAAKKPERKPNASEAYRLNRSEEHTSELQSRLHLVCRLLLEKKKKKLKDIHTGSTSTCKMSSAILSAVLR